MKLLYILGVVSVLLPLSAGANGNYPPEIPDAEVMPFKVIGGVTLKLYVFKPEGWKVTDKRPAAVFFFGGGWNHGSKSSAPCVIFHGKEDVSIPYATVEKFTGLMTAAGVRCELFGYEDAGHGFYNSGRGRDQTCAAMDTFLVSLGWLKPGSG